MPVAPVSSDSTLEALEARADFRARHIGPDGVDQQEMLSHLGLSSLDELIDLVVPREIRMDSPISLPGPATEAEVVERLRAFASRNRVMTSLIGMGYSASHVPGVILRNVMENPAWYTAYTPYQPEISQGRLEALLNFQTVIADLTALPLANASLLDEATAAAEAMAMCRRVNPTAGDRYLVDRDCHPQTIDVVTTRAVPLGIEVVVGDAGAGAVPDGTFGVLVQFPGTSGEVRDHTELIRLAHAAGALVTVAADLLGLVLLRPPGEIGADVVVGSSQRFGVPMAFGGPHAGYLATREEHKRALPGRLVGVSVDSAGRPALRLTLQTREQHIRRERATSNICTAQVLLAVMAGMYATYHGPDGLRRIAGRVQRMTAILAAGLRLGGIEVTTLTTFDTITVRVPGRARAISDAALAAGINLRWVDADTLGISLDETTTRETVGDVWAAFGVEASTAHLDETLEVRLPDGLARQSGFLTHPVFHSHRSETEMLRYLRRLADRDIALDRSMIPLGSCTMKLNATTEMIPITWPEFASLHPFAPLDQAAGYRELISDLERALVEITGYDAVSLQPNAGSQGELAGLLAIQAFHRSRGQGQRSLCLIPASAHGTNAASASMAGLEVVVVACDSEGNVDVGDLGEKVAAAGDRLSCTMITYPSTHGVFEAAITEICEVVHAGGGQVYLDGANLNALVGVARPGSFGADVSHLNLHKTFCIPHGGGGPGVGPVAVREHLAPFLPNHPVVQEAGPASGVGAIAAAPWGSAGILPISWAYVTLMGGEGLREATQVAILSANYLAQRLAPHYPILYTGRNGMVAHECILDLRAMTASTGVTVDDVAKRLIDFGFHAPTMSFPVAGTFMVEPTESESKAELDRFVDAMVAIRQEIDAIAGGSIALDRSALRRAPHTAADLVEASWDRDYTREEAAFPAGISHSDKYFPPVGRIDGAFGDRHLFCTCPPVGDDVPAPASGGTQPN